MKSTEVAAMQVETGIMPLKLRRLEQQIKFAITIKTTNNHPAAKVIQDDWTLHYGTKAINKTCIFNNTKDFFDQHKQVLETKKLPEIPPWHFINNTVDIGLADIIRKDECPDKIKSISLEYFEKYQNSMHIYTDGSKSDSGRVSSAFFVKEKDLKFKYRITDKLTIYTAELVAIRETLNWVIQNENRFNNVHNIAIFSDSKSSLESLNKEKSAERPNLLIEILETLTKIHTKITFVWIPAHVGLPGNEIADQLAKSAINSANIDLEVAFEARELYPMVQQYITKKWQECWDKNPTLNHYKILEPKVNNKGKFIGKNCRKNQVQITRLRLGACCLNTHLQKIGCHPDGLCDSCKVPDTIEHFILSCTKTNIATNLQNKCAKLNVGFNIINCLSRPDLIDCICKNISNFKL